MVDNRFLSVKEENMLSFPFSFSVSTSPKNKSIITKIRIEIGTPKSPIILRMDDVRKFDPRNLRSAIARAKHPRQRSVLISATLELMQVTKP